MLPLAAAALILLNDLVLRPAFPGWITGKLSDLGWLIVVPFILGVVAPRRLAIGLTAAVYVALQLWPPLGAFFNPAHVADLGDLVVLPILALPYRYWRRPDWTLVPPLALTLLADSFGVSSPGSWPCENSGDWDPAAALQFQIGEVSPPVNSDGFARGISLVDENGADVPIVVVEGDMYIHACARDGLKGDTWYTWTLGPWHITDSNAVPMDNPGLPPVEFHTGPGEGIPVASGAECLALVPELSQEESDACDPYADEDTGG